MRKLFSLVHFIIALAGFVSFLVYYAYGHMAPLLVFVSLFVVTLGMLLFNVFDVLAVDFSGLRGWRWALITAAMLAVLLLINSIMLAFFAAIFWQAMLLTFIKADWIAFRKRRIKEEVERMNSTYLEITEGIVKEFLREESATVVSYNTWVNPLKFEFEEGVMRVTVPQKLWHTKYIDLIETRVPEEFEAIMQVIFYYPAEA